MNEHPHAARVRALCGAMARRDAAAIAAQIPPDAVWRFPGRRGKLAGEHRGREAILRFLGSVMALTEGTFELELHDIIGGDDHVAVIFTGKGRRDGKRLENPTCLLITMNDGEAVEFREFVWDLEHVEEFWS